MKMADAAPGGRQPQETTGGGGKRRNTERNTRFSIIRSPAPKIRPRPVQGGFGSPLESPE
jgi:hypothetical protein